MLAFRSWLCRLACLGLVASQLTGLHMHADPEGHVGGLEGNHLHRTVLDAHEHDEHHEDHDHHGDADHHSAPPDHDGDRDISVFELGSGVSKVLFVVGWIAGGIAIFLAPAKQILYAAVPRPLNGRRVRWRPPMRAPPRVLPLLA